MNIGIDCRLAGSKHAGIGRYISELVKEVTKSETHTWVLFFFDQQQADEMLSNRNKLSNVIVKYVPIRHYTLAEQLRLPHHFQAAQLDLLHVPHFNVPLFYTGKVVVTIHDLLWHDHRGTTVTTLPHWQYWIKYFFYRLVTTFAVKRAHAIIVPTKTIRSILKQYYPQAKKKTSVITEGYPQELLKSAAQHGTITRKKQQLLYVGSLYPHKNVELVLRALKQLPDYKLVIVGARSVFLDKTQQTAMRLGVSSQVSFRGFLPDSELAKMYLESAALIQPSFSEGFGLTGLEALALNTPVLASTIPTFKEIYQRAAIYFDPTSPDSFVRAVGALKKQPISDFIPTARSVVKQYSWSQMAKETLKLYTQLD